MPGASVYASIRGDEGCNMEVICAPRLSAALDIRVWRNPALHWSHRDDGFGHDAKCHDWLLTGVELDSRKVARCERFQRVYWSQPTRAVADRQN